MPKSLPFTKVLSRLGVRGSVTAIEDTPPGGKFESYVPLLGTNNKIHGSLIDASTVTVDTVVAENVGFTDLPTGFDPAVDNVRDALNAIIDGTTGLAALRAHNLSDLVDKDAAFNIIKMAAGSVTAGDAVGGVVGVATNTQVIDAVDAATDLSCGSLPLVVPPSLIKTNYLRKTDSASQTLQGAIVIPNLNGGSPGGSATNKTYVDTAVAAANQFPVGNTVWVDPINGNDSTAERGKMGRPALTLAKARDLAASGDVIIVNPGTYNENNLSKNGVSWYFRPGAIINYSSGGTSSIGIFDIAANHTCHILGYGEFWNTFTGLSDNFVLYVRSGSKCVFEARFVQSRRTPIYVDAGSTGYAQISIKDALRSQDGTDGASAAKLISGVCNLDVGREIYSGASVAQAGLVFGTGALTPTATWHVVRCPLIWGKFNAIHFNSTTRAQVTADTCYATDGPAVRADGGTRNILSVTGDLHTDDTASGTIVLTKGKLQCNQTYINALNGQPAIIINGSPYDTSPAYLVLSNTEIWTQNTNSNAISANTPGIFPVRIVGAVQSDCHEPTTVIRRGGVWDYISSLLV